MGQPAGAGGWGTLLEQQIERHGRDLFGVAVGILRDAQAAEDACQQAYLKAWEQRDAVREPTALRAWLTRVVINECFAALRRRKTQREAMAKHTAELRIAAEPVEDGLAVKESVVRAVERLPEPTRAIVVLRLMHGRSGNEVKAMLGCSASEVSRRLHAGMDELRRLLSDWSLHPER